MRWDVTPGSWPAFWMIASQDATGQDIHNGVKETGEIDIFEGQGDQPRTFYGTIHDWINDQHTTNSPNWYVLPTDFNSTEFHTYGLLWVPGRVTWYLDDKALFSAPTPTVVDSEDFFLVLGSQEGAKWEPGSMDGVTAQKITMDVDWVRVWQRR
jgi:beta-glucanase (GH16 family)